jgi:NAD(P)-dependent dehydrogenase (short-subunit alcohol dehydrogenase family)
MAALITGGGSGIGLACARRLLRDGAAVTIMGRTAEKLEKAVEALRGEVPQNGGIAWFSGDVTQEADMTAAVEKACEPTGKLDIAVANAGGGGAAPILDTSIEEWDYTIGVNLTGTFLTIKAAGQVMAKNGGGSIIAVSSLAGIVTHRFAGPYCASKAGIEMLIRTVADELGPLGIRANVVRPGIVPTSELGSILAEDNEMIRDYVGQIPLGRVGTPDEIAEGVRYLAGPESAWVTGQCFGVDGGQSLRRGPRWESLVERLRGPEAIERLDERKK